MTTRYCCALQEVGPASCEEQPGAGGVPAVPALGHSPIPWSLPLDTAPCPSPFSRTRPHVPVPAFGTRLHVLVPALGHGHSCPATGRPCSVLQLMFRYCEGIRIKGDENTPSPHGLQPLPTQTRLPALQDKRSSRAVPAQSRPTTGRESV